MKSLISIMLFVACSVSAYSQSLTIDECQRLARENYPSIRQMDFIESTKQYTIENAKTAYLPQVSLSSQATYQNAVTEYPDAMKKAFGNMGVNMKGLNKDQYKIGVDVNQVIWDGGAIKSKNRITLSESEAEKQQVEVELYGLKDRVNALYFGILLLEAQEKENTNMQQLLQSNCEKIQTMINNHTALPSDLNTVKAELLSTRQQYTQIAAACKSYRQMLSLFIHQDTEKAELEMPSALAVDSKMINRPELALFEAQQKGVEAHRSAIYTALHPQVGAFAQGYYGNPGFNLFKDMMENKWTVNVMVGIRLKWNFGSLYTQKRDLTNLHIASQRIETQKQTFLFNTLIITTKQQNAIDEMRKILNDDDEIISLRTSVRKASESKLNNGIINVNDLLRDITSENNSKIAKATHEIELINRIYQLKNTINE